MGDAFPELKAQQVLITKVIKEEEDSFLRTLDKGIGMLNEAMDKLKAENKTELDGVQAFRLFDTYGFPLDLTELTCRENGFTVNEEQFNVEMQKQKERARNAAAVENGDWIAPLSSPEGDTNVSQGNEAPSGAVGQPRQGQFNQRGGTARGYCWIVLNCHLRLSYGHTAYR